VMSAGCFSIGRFWRRSAITRRNWREVACRCCFADLRRGSRIWRAPMGLRGRPCPRAEHGQVQHSSCARNSETRPPRLADLRARALRARCTWVYADLILSLASVRVMRGLEPRIQDGTRRG
jgi:hypothetical protein